MLKYQSLMLKIKDRLINDPKNTEKKLPPLADIAKLENCSLNTVQRAVAELKKEGFITTKTGQGTYLNTEAPKNDEKGEKLPVRFINCCGFHMTKDSMLGEFFQSLDAVMFKEARSIHSHSLIKVGGVIAPLSESDLSIPVYGNILYCPYNDELADYFRKRCKNILSIDKDLTHLGIDSLVYDNIASSFLAVKKLLELGHKKVAYIGSKQTVPEANGFDPAMTERFKGYQTALTVNGIPYDESIVKPVESRVTSASVKALEELLASGAKFTAIVFFQNCHREFIEILGQHGLRVPEDVSLVSAGKIKNMSTLSGGAFSLSHMGPIAWQLMQRRMKLSQEGILPSQENAELYAIAPEFDMGETLSKVKA